VLAEEPSVLVKIDAASLVRSGDDHEPATVVHHYVAVKLLIGVILQAAHYFITR
jgi:hypothetical protein